MTMGTLDSIGRIGKDWGTLCYTLLLHHLYHSVYITVYHRLVHKNETRMKRTKIATRPYKGKFKPSESLNLYFLHCSRCYNEIILSYLGAFKERKKIKRR